jgi:tetratricopeptide (TPR) repeat protein
MSELHDRVHAFADGDLSAEEAGAFRAHLGTCARCQEELEDVLQLQALGARLAAEAPRTPAVEGSRPRAFRPAWSLRRTKLAAAAVGGLLAVALNLLVLREGPPEPPESLGPGALALAPTRTLEARLSHPGAAAYRPYGVSRSGGQAPLELVPLETLVRLEQAGDFHGVATGHLLRGEPEKARAQLQRAGRSPQVDSDKAVLALARGEPAEALRLLDGVLQAHPRHPQALWNRALALHALGREAEAAEAFRQVAALGEPGWSEEARERAEALERR